MRPSYTMVLVLVSTLDPEQRLLINTTDHLRSCAMCKTIVTWTIRDVEAPSVGGGCKNLFPTLSIEWPVIHLKVPVPTTPEAFTVYGHGGMEVAEPPRGPFSVPRLQLRCLMITGTSSCPRKPQYAARNGVRTCHKLIR